MASWVNRTFSYQLVYVTSHTTLLVWLLYEYTQFKFFDSINIPRALRTLRTIRKQQNQQSQPSNFLRSQLIKQHIRIGIILHLLLHQWSPLRIIETEPIEFPLIFWIRRHVDKRNVVTSARRSQMVNHSDQVISHPHSLSPILHHASFLHSKVFRHVQSLPPDTFHSVSRTRVIGTNKADTR